LGDGGRAHPGVPDGVANIFGVEMKEKGEVMSRLVIGDRAADSPLAGGAILGIAQIISRIELRCTRRFDRRRSLKCLRKDAWIQHQLRFADFRKLN
jgi:hypothetical protein